MELQIKKWMDIGMLPLQGQLLQYYLLTAVLQMEIMVANPPPPKELLKSFRF